MTDAELLARAPVFSGLDAAALAAIASRVRSIAVATDELLCAEGSPPEALYVVAEGELAVTKRVGDGDETLLNVCGPGEVIGEMSLLEQLPRSASVRATRPGRVLRLGADAFDELIRTSPAIALAILRVVTSRLRNTESVLRQFDKLTALGRIAAGIAHELDNPAAALVRGAATLDDATRGARAITLALAAPEVSVALGEAVAADSGAPALGALARSEREAELERVLARHGVDDAWLCAPSLVRAGWTADRLDAVAARLGPAAGAGLRWLGLGRVADEVVAELAAGARRISELVASVRSYAHLGAAPVTRVDVRAGVEAALALLSHKLRRVRIVRVFADDLPAVDARGAELNQVWTNLLDNAVDAVAGAGTIEIEVAATSGGIAVTIADDGPGIPEEVRSRLFEPFFTTKPPGVGTGLGLHIAYDVVVRRHRGKIAVASRPGRTAFRVELPLALPSPGAREPA